MAKDNFKGDLNYFSNSSDFMEINQDSLNSETEKNLPMEEIPYFFGKWPNKVCALCSLDERSQLGQGEMLRLEISDLDRRMIEIDEQNEPLDALEPSDKNESLLPIQSLRRSKSINKNKPANNSEYIDEIEKVGQSSIIEFSKLQDSQYFYVHRLCAVWSFGIQRELNGAFSRTALVVAQSLKRKCSYCNHYGASIACKMSCPTFFHLPCVAASGGFQIIDNFTFFCKTHINQVINVCGDNNISCSHCSDLGDIANLIMCTICGDHYHGLCIGVKNLPGVRTGWQCKSCSKCQICRISDSNEGKTLSCEQCHKVYHAHCFRPIMSSIPKIGWKCRRCRVCSDCGSRTPGAGASSRWHSHYTICDSCYQQRNKGFSCPICHRAYRAASYKEMVKCSNCQKFVHSTCDLEADLAVYHKKKENNPDYDYICPPCKSLELNGYVLQSIQKNTILDEEAAINKMDSNFISTVNELNATKQLSFAHGKGKPYTSIKLVKKRFGSNNLNRNKDNKFILKKKIRFSDINRKRGQKSKIKNIFDSGGLSLQRPTVDNSKNKMEEDPGTENKLVLCSAKDKFILTQDICIMCGSLGADEESCLISCTQCGQCYHPYCVNVKITKVILEKGWRCLDCTVCEGCGQKNDEARLILCDECDISFHIYCIEPPLEYVPQGNWKCKWCTTCQKCGSDSPGENCSWRNSYTECGPCASENSCVVCSNSYDEGELIIKCSNCNQWLHCKCDSIENEDDAEKCNNLYYRCPLCRPKDILPPHLCQFNNALISNYQNENVLADNGESFLSQSLDISHYMDGVCLSEEGFSLMKSLQTEIKKRRKLKSGLDLSSNKNSGVLAAIESVVAGTVRDGCFDDIKMEDSKEEIEIYKDGMVWEKRDVSPPSGFALATNENGVIFLRKKRQRNLQKLGIGGFNVRNRNVKKDSLPREEPDDTFELTSFLETDKRKKPKKKQIKSKLCDAYPEYLQEAFFGKCLLDVKSNNFESDSTDDERKAIINDKFVPSNEDNNREMTPDNMFVGNCSKDLRNINSLSSESISCNSLLKNGHDKPIITTFSSDYQLKPVITNNNDSCFDTNVSINDNSMISNSTPIANNLNKFNVGNKKESSEELLHNATMGVINNLLVDNTQLRIHSGNLDHNKYKDDIDDKIAQVDSFKDILHNKRYNYDIVKPSIDDEPIKFIDSQILKEDSPSSTCNVAGIGLNDNNLSNLKEPLSSSTYEHKNNPFELLAVSSEVRKEDLDQVTSTIEETLSINAVVHPSQLSTSAGKVETTGNTTKFALKPTERMRIDEDLGKMATISAVLYANICYPNLIKDYPVWSDRCKQIYKLWRGLPNEKKTLFLQQAKDNRSALRNKKNQQAQHHAGTQKKLDKLIHLPKNDHNIESFQINDTAIVKENINRVITNQNFKLLNVEEKMLNVWESPKETSLPLFHNSESIELNKSFNPFPKSSLLVPEISNEIKTILAPENNSINDVADIFGNFPDDDEFELLRSLTAEIGDDFNLLKYTDPEMELVDAPVTANILDTPITNVSDEQIENQKNNLQFKITGNNPINNCSGGDKFDIRSVQTSLKPPPPYPGPPPPYPVNSEQILPDLSEQKGCTVLTSGSIEAVQYWPVTQNNLSQHANNEYRNWNSNDKLDSYTTDIKPKAQMDRTKKTLSFNLNLPQRPPSPPGEISTESDREVQSAYEDWLQSINTQLANHIKYYEDEITKIKKTKRTLSGKKRTLKKNGGELTEISSEHAAASSNQTVLQKQLDYVKKQVRNHMNLMQNYNQKYKKCDGGLVPSNSVTPTVAQGTMDHSSLFILKNNNSELVTIPVRDALDVGYNKSFPMLEKLPTSTQNGTCSSMEVSTFTNPIMINSIASKMRAENTNNRSIINRIVNNDGNLDMHSPRVYQQKTQQQIENKSLQGSSSSSTYTEQYFPITEHFARFGRIKIGLFGGAPVNSSRSLSPKSKKGMNCELESSDDIINTTKELNINNTNQFKENPILLNDRTNGENSKVPEVSLNSVAANPNDIEDMSVIKSFTSSELPDITSSPLESDAVDDYMLFAPDMVGYVESDDSLKTEYTSKNYNLNSLIHDTSEVELKSIQTELPKNVIVNASKSQPGSYVEGSVTVPWKIQSTKGNTFPVSETGSNYQMISTNLVTTYKTITSSAETCKVISSSQSTIKPQTVVMTAKKITPDVTQTTAKVSIGNTTISVPLLKPVTINSSHVVPTSKATKVTKGMSFSKQPTIYVRGQRITPTTLVSLSQVQIKPSTNTKIVQAKVIGKKIQLPPTSSDSGLIPTKQNMIHTLLYPKMTQISHDLSLPNKIFEDEPSSPNNSPSAQSEVSVDNCESKDILGNIKASKKIIIKKLPSANITSGEMFVQKVSPSITVNSECEHLSTFAQAKNDCSGVPAKILGNTIKFSNEAQLSPLPKPTDITSNMANASQELMNIMSGISTSKTDVKNDSDTISLVKTAGDVDPDLKSNSFNFTSNEHIRVSRISLENVFKNSGSGEFYDVGFSQKDSGSTRKDSDTFQQTHFKRSKSTDDGTEKDIPAHISTSKRLSLDVNTEQHNSNVSRAIPEILNSYSNDNIICKVDEDNTSCANNGLVSKITICRSDETQNVLLKQLLQNSTSTSNEQATLGQQLLPGRKPGVRAPSLGLVSSLEAQLARPVIPPVPANTTLIMTPSKNAIQSKSGLPKPEFEISKMKTQIFTKETSFVSNPDMNIASTPFQTQSKPDDMNAKEINSYAGASESPKDRHENIISQHEVSISVEKAVLSTHQMSQTTDKKNYEEPISYSSIGKLERSPTIDQQFANATDSDILNQKTDDKLFDLNSELRKKRKRDYQKQRRQQINKDNVRYKKKSKKNYHIDEDYDSFIDNLVIQLRQMLPLQVLEPLLNRNYGICAIYGSGDLADTTGKDKKNTFIGDYGNICSDVMPDFYELKPYGHNETLEQKLADTIQNGFYDQEFQPIQTENDWNTVQEMNNIFKDRIVDSPESIILSSSPQSFFPEMCSMYPCISMPFEDLGKCHEVKRTISPTISIVSPIALRGRLGIDVAKCTKPFSNNRILNCAARNTKIQQLENEDDANISVTLTLTSSVAENIIDVLRALANILHVSPPTNYKIVERITSPPNHQIGIHKNKAPNGKLSEQPIDIQKILNGSVKFCRHCDIVILNTAINAKASEFPLLATSELLSSLEDLTFCSKVCYQQFKWRPTNIIDDHMTINATKSTKTISNDLRRTCQNSGFNLPLENLIIEPKNSKSGNRFKYYKSSKQSFASDVKKNSDKEIIEMLFKMGITISPPRNKILDDTRQCIFCNITGDGVSDGPSRLLNFDVDKWVHLNCALWSDGVYETVNGGLMNLDAALQASCHQICSLCHQLGATIKCFKSRCTNIYHLTCAVKDNCAFYKNKTTNCSTHASKLDKENILTSLNVLRRVYVERDEPRQVAAVMHHAELSNLIRVGSLTFLSVGQLLPHQLQPFHTPDYIYPIGYKIIRLYWSMKNANKRCRYVCSIAEVHGFPEFRILVQEPEDEDTEFKGNTPSIVWQYVIETIANLRQSHGLVQLFPKYITGEDLFGLTEPVVVRILESLPGIETLTDYKFKYGRNPLLELPLAINPSGSARTEPKQKHTVGWRKPHTQRTGSTFQRISMPATQSIAGEVTCPYSKQFVHSKSSQYKKMKQEWRNNVYLARSKIQGLGLYAARDLEKHTMVIEYIGEVIRTEVSEIREKQYDARNRGIYMFRLDGDRVVDATLSGGLARYINHSCNPNCVTEIVDVDREFRIIIFAKRRIHRGEELSYDYKFDIEDDAHKISCMCSAPNCRKWMN